MTEKERIKSGLTQEESIKKQPLKLLHGEEHIGLKGRMSNGLDASIIEYKNKEKVTILFEDGEKAQGSLSNFYKGLIAHPMLSAVKKCKYGCMTVKHIARLCDNNSYYLVECDECKKMFPHKSEKYRDIITAQDIVAHKISHEQS